MHGRRLAIRSDVAPVSGVNSPVIAVLCNRSEEAIAEEFFQLFKTPWELFREGRRYDVVISTDDRVPDISPRLLVIYGSESRRVDARIGTGDPRPGPAALAYKDFDLPIYGGHLAFEMLEAGAKVIDAGRLAGGIRSDSEDGTLLRLGYDLFREVELLLTAGQPPERSEAPALEIHIEILRDAMLQAAVCFIEIPAIPHGFTHAVCLTHDIDFFGIRDHLFDHTMWGFVYRSTVAALKACIARRISVSRLLRMWRSVALLPFVYLRVAKDFWLPFEWYLHVEHDLSATYFLVPFKNVPGENLAVKHRERRATKYDVSDIPDWISVLEAAGHEIAVHGIDAWHSIDRARKERARIEDFASTTVSGIRMHWLIQDRRTWSVLDEAGFAYDSTAGYNDAIGYRCGTTQVFRPPGATRLLELPLHIQDGALFFPGQLGLSETEAWRSCSRMIERVRRLGGVLTTLWHDRSHGPERFWGDFYIRLLDELRLSGAWFGSASQVVQWFRWRRGVRFVQERSPEGEESLRLVYEGTDITPPLTLRIHRSSSGATVPGYPKMAPDVSWSGTPTLTFDPAKEDLTEFFDPAHRAPSQGPADVQLGPT